MTSVKSLFFSILFLGALTGAGFILYEKQNNLTVHQQPPEPDSSSVVTSGEFKPEKETKNILGTTSTYSKEFTAARISLHTTINAENIIWQTNYERVKTGLDPLIARPELMRSAGDKNSDMVRHQYFEHNRRSGGSEPVGFDTFIDHQGYSFIKIGENLAMGNFATSREVVTAWMNSPTHKKNILDPQYREIGVAVKKATMDDKETFLFTQHFGNPRTSCPPVNESSKQTIEDLRSSVLNLQQEIAGHRALLPEHNNGLPDSNFNNLVEDYNKLVAQYNTNINRISDLVKQYNTQVQNFDDCIQGR